MSNDPVKEFIELSRGPFNLYGVFYYVARAYIDSKQKLLANHKKASGLNSLKWITFSSSKVGSDIKLMREAFSIVNNNPGDKDTIINQFKMQPQKLNFHDDKARNFIKLYIEALKNDNPLSCCCCGNRKTKLKKCEICNNYVCHSDTVRINFKELSQSPRMSKYYERKQYLACKRCSHFAKESLPVMKYFFERLYQKFDYIILGQEHERGIYAGTSFLYQFINNGYLKTVVTFSEVMFQAESDNFKNYTNNIEVKRLFADQLSQFNQSKITCNNIANVLELYTSNKAAYFSKSPELDALQIICNKHRVPIYTFDNSETVPPLGKGFYLRRQSKNDMVASRIKHETRRFTGAKAMIPIGKNHISGQFALQQYLPNSCTIQCVVGAPGIRPFRANPSRGKAPASQIPQYVLSWPNIFTQPFLPHY
ncbi:MAG: hypothetical protein GY750_08270 [Lentisphaerae bacterium]|nr:hypothetical protein [Lentisphaerota bacterium]MCP4101404.1 hypothetical protein [Lentisphaerota bacterium]